MQPGASPHPHHRRTAEQMRRRRDRILQRKEAAVAAAAAAANDGDVAAQQAKRRAAKEASAIVEQALAAGVKDGDAILRMVDDQVATEHDAGDGRVAAAAKDATDDADIGVDESLSMVSCRSDDNGCEWHVFSNSVRAAFSCLSCYTYALWWPIRSVD